jgi:hypothetical protein
MRRGVLVKVVFENPGHDFPQVIGYQRRGASLLARVEGKKAQTRAGSSSPTSAVRVRVSELLRTL